MEEVAAKVVAAVADGVCVCAFLDVKQQGVPSWALEGRPQATMQATASTEGKRKRTVYKCSSLCMLSHSLLLCNAETRVHAGKLA